CDPSNELIGERVRRIVTAGDTYIGLRDRATNMIHFPYEVDTKLGRVHADPIPLGHGMTSRVLETGKPLRLGTFGELVANGMTTGRYAEGESAVHGESWLGVPILAREKAIGTVASGPDRHAAHREAHEHLASTS